MQARSDDGLAVLTQEDAPQNGLGSAALADTERAVSSNGAGASPDGLLVTGIGKRWRTGGRANWVLRDLDLEAPAGSVTWVGGSNGSGKTTLLRLIAGVLAPDGGAVQFRGLDPERQRCDYQRRLGILPAGDRGLYARLSVRNHLRFWSRIAFVSRSSRRACAEQAIEAFSLGDLVDRRVDRMSLGQRQRLRLALTFMHEPELTLLDEPTTSLDEEGLELLRSAVSGVTDRGGVVIWCSPPVDRRTIDSDLELVLHGGRLRKA